MDPNINRKSGEEQYNDERSITVCRAKRPIVKGNSLEKS